MRKLLSTIILLLSGSTLATTQNVGIGIASPAAKLHIQALDYNTSFRITTAGGVGPGVYLDAANRDWVIIGTNAGAGAGDEKFALYDQTALLYRLVVDAAGNMGIGTTAPTQRLEVAGGLRIGNTATGSAGALRWTGSAFEGHNGAAWQTLGADNLGNHIAAANLRLGSYWLSGDGGSEGIAIDAVGNVQVSTGRIITTNPTDVFTHNTNALGHYSLGWMNDGWDATGQTASLSGYAGIKLFTAGANQVAITRLGNVGIGTESPAARIHIAGTDYNTGLRVTTGGGAGAGLLLDASTRDWALLATNAAAGAGAGKFGLFDETAGQYRLVVDGNGSVGMGTVNPARTLDVAGTGRFAGALTVGAYTLPIADGTTGQVLGTDGSGNAAWTTAGQLPSSAIVLSQTQTNPALTAAGFSLVGRMPGIETYAEEDGWQPIATGPIGRTDFSMVWTGSQMLVWGGRALSTTLTDGAAYNPATNVWTTISNAGVPAGRYYHTAVWTGTKMIIWGGMDAGGNYLNSGGVYDLATNTWTPMSTTGAPEGRTHHTAVWTGSQMIVWGGITFDGSNVNPENTGAAYNPATNTWVALGSAGTVPLARFAHKSIWTGSKMMVWGGQTSAIVAVVTNTGALYDPVTGIWSATNTAGAPSVFDPAAVWTGNLLFVWGGLDSGTSNYTNTGAMYDPTTNAWTATSATGNVPPAVGGTPAAVWTGSRVMVWGGTTNSGFFTANTGAEFDPATNTWVAQTSLYGTPPTARTGHVAVWSGSTLVVWGGYDALAPNPAAGGKYEYGSVPMYHSSGYVYLFKKN